jgi:hypothetical protein
MALKSFQTDKFNECFGFALGFAKLLSSSIESKKHVAQHRAPGEERFIELLENQTRFGGGPLTARPFTKILPVVEAISPAMDMSKVVLPQPEGPTKQTNSPASTWQEILPIAIVVSPPIWR